MLTSLLTILPELVLIAAVFVVLLVDVLVKGRGAHRAALVATTVACLLVAAGAFALAPSGTTFQGMIIADDFGRFFRVLFLIAAFFGLALAALSEEIPDARLGEFIALLLSTTVGMALLVQSRHLLMVLLSIELISLPSYAMAGFRRGDHRSSEAALKYVIYGAAASGLMLYGFSVLYAMTGTLDFVRLSQALSGRMADAGAPLKLMLTLGGLAALTGYGYKIAAVPFHQWCPDVYEGAPTPVTAFLSVGPKAAGVVALMRFVIEVFGSPMEVLGSASGLPWPMFLGVLAIATMTLGNLAAIWQDNVKRLMAYSSIAHAGYLLIGVAVATPAAMQAVAMYLPIYLLMNLGVFLAVILVREKTGSESIDAYRGLAARNPVLAVTVAIFLFSLVGVPPFAGFIAKFYLFAAALQTGTGFFYAVAIIGVLNAVVSLFYYMRLVRAMFLEASPDGAPAIPVPRSALVLLLILSVPTLVLGVWWEPLANLAELAVL